MLNSLETETPCRLSGGDTIPPIRDQPAPPRPQRPKKKLSSTRDDIKRLFIPLAIALVILLGYNVVIGFAAKKTQRQHLLRALNSLPAPTDCVFLGNSLIEAGADASAFKSAWSRAEGAPVAVNLGLGATTPVEHYLILKRAFEQPVHIKYVIYGFFDDQLNAAPKGAWQDLIGNRAFSYYFPKDAASFYEPNSRLEAWELETTELVPMLAERSSLWDRVELARRRLDAIGMPAQQINRFGRANDFNALEAKDVPSFVERCDTILKGRQGFSAPIKAMIDLAHEHGAKFFLVEMPMSPRHRETFYSLPVWAEMRAHLQLLAQQQQVAYVTASDWVADGKNFEDTLHLNENGARDFSARLGTTLSQISTESQNQLMAKGK